jgi:hypothetical protein
MEVGDLVRWFKTNQIGIILDIFGDLNPDDPWVRVMFQKENQQTFRWCKISSLVPIKKEGAETDPSS